MRDRLVTHGAADGMGLDNGTAHRQVDSFKAMPPLVAVQCGCLPMEKLQPSPGMRTTKKMASLK